MRSPAPNARRLLALLLPLMLLAPAAFAAELAAPLPPAGVVRSGDIVETRVEAIPAGTREFELFVLLDSGQLVRVSAERDAREGRIVWRMPKLAARSARLVLRTGGAHGERESAPSPAFAIAAPEPSELAALRQGRSEAGHLLETPATGATSEWSTRPDHAELVMGRVVAPAVEAPSPGCEAPAWTASRFDSRAPAPHRAADRPILTRRPVVVFLRN